MRELCITRTRRIGSFSVCADEYARAGSTRESSGARTISNRKRQAALVSNDPTDGPVAEELILEETALWYGNIVGIAHDKPVWTIKVAACLVLLRVRSIVEDVSSSLTVACGIKLIRTLRTTDVVNGL